MRSTKSGSLALSVLLVACGGSDDLSQDTDPQLDTAADSTGDTSDLADTTDAADLSETEDAPDTDTADTADAADAADADDTTDTDETTDTVDTTDTTDAEDTADTEDVADTDAIDPTGLATVRGRVVLWGSQDLTGIAGAVVRAGSVETVADAAGRFELTGVDAGVAISVSVAAGPGGGVYSSFHQRTVLAADETRTMVVPLLPGCSATVAVDSTDGVILPTECGTPGSYISLRLPAGGVVNAAGEAVARVRAEMAVLPVSTLGGATSDGLRAFPGHMDAVAEGGGAVYLESLGAAEVRLYDADTDEPVQLATGETATLQFLADARSFDRDLDSGIAAWWYDAERGMWVEEGAMTTETVPFVPVLLQSVEVSHFTWWNADQVATRACVTGRVVDGSGAPLAGSDVAALGLSYNGSSGAGAGADGRFSVFARAASEILVRAVHSTGTAEASATRLAQTGLAGEACVDVGDVVIDVSAQSACARGRVVDESGAAIEGADVVSYSREGTVITRSGADGAYCLPVTPGAPSDVWAQGVVDGVTFKGRLAGIRAEVGTGLCSDTPTACATLPDLEVRSLGCVRGVVTSEFGAAAGARVSSATAAQFGYDETSSDGAYCIEVERVASPLVRVNATVVGAPRTASALLFEPGLDQGACVEPLSCAQLDLALDGSQCVRAQVVDDAGAPVTAAQVTVRESSGWERVVTTDAEGLFCAPASASSAVDLTVEKVRGGVRQRGAATVLTGSTAASCGTGDCTDAGQIVVTSESFTSCITGRASWSDLAITDELRVTVDGVDTVAWPDDRGVFCVGVPLATVATLSWEGGLGGCIRPPDTDVALDALTAGSCANPASCLDAGDLDFATFCEFS